MEHLSMGQLHITSWIYQTNQVIMFDGPSRSESSNGDGTSGMEPEQDQRVQQAARPGSPYSHVINYSCLYLSLSSCIWLIGILGNQLREEEGVWASLWMLLLVCGNKLKMDTGCIAVTSGVALKSWEKLGKLLRGQSCEWCTCSSSLDGRKSGLKWQHVVFWAVTGGFPDWSGAEKKGKIKDKQVWSRGTLLGSMHEELGRQGTCW